MKRIIAFLFALAMLVNIGYAENVFEQPVPFGVITCSGSVDVRKSILARNTVGKVSDGQICAIIEEQSTWYKIVFFSGKEEKTGYIESEYVNQLTVAGLVNLLSDSDVSSTIRKFSELKASNEYVEVATVAASVTDAKSRSEKEITYVLNRNTKKFHLPSCTSVNDVAKKNRKDFTGTREEVINMGYVPCKRCNP